MAGVSRAKALDILILVKKRGLNSKQIEI